MTDIRNSPALQHRSPQQLSYRPDIDGLRAIAVLAVVGFHVFPQWVKGGFVGVDVFFVISGFLISGLVFAEIGNAGFGFARFYARRVRRLFPALIVVLAVAWCLGWVYLLPKDFMQLGKHIAGSAGFVANFVLWGESGYFDKAAAVKPLLHIWSLGVEEQFYLVLPLLWVLAWRLRIGIVAFTLVLIAASFALNMGMMRNSPVGAFYSPLTRIWEILLGSLLAAMPAEKCACGGWVDRLHVWSRQIPANVKSLVGLALVGGAVMMLNKQQAFPGWRALIPTLGTCLLIAAGPDTWLNRRLLAHKLLVGIGLISYPLYLWHWLFVAAAANVFPREAPLFPLGSGLAVISLSIVLAAATYFLIEKPIRFGNRLPTALLCVVMILMAILGGITWQNKGFKSRFHFDEYFPGLAASRENYDRDWFRQVRKGRCFLDSYDSRFGDCIERDGRPLILLWGDSYAASLYIGLRNLQSRENFALAQFNVSSCPPLPDFIGVSARWNCPEMSKEILQAAVLSAPQIVLLHSNWEKEDYGLYDPVSGKFDFDKLTQTIQSLKNAGIKRIVLIGPAPYWHWYLSDLVMNHYRWGDPLHRVPPARMKTSDAMEAIDAQMRRFAKEAGVEFISIAEILCNEEGCLTRLGNDFSTITSMDSGHLTPQTSQYLIDRIANQILGRQAR